jgi:hypothetical protein
MSDSSNSNNNDYKVGYKKPPKKTQFRKGQSGNPRGSKKTREIDDIRIVIEDVLAELVKVRQGGKERVVSREEAIMNAELMNALNGDPKATEALFKRGQKCDLFSKAKRQSLLIRTEAEGDDGKIVRMFHAEQEAPQSSAEDIAAGSRNKTPSKDH